MPMRRRRRVQERRRMKERRIIEKVNYEQEWICSQNGDVQCLLYSHSHFVPHSN
jgi:hypothetical protein